MEVGVVSRVVHPLHGHGGMEKHVHQLVTGLAERGVEVELFCMETGEEIPEELRRENLEITFVPYREFSIGKLSYFSFIQHLFPYFHRLDEKDLVHFHGMTGGVPYAFL
ncbi:MAG: glycosyltransferase, partial [Candidatus Nanohaloarchaea archaeon]|nr:glycosyltransferase [Candidatus Nanohaloarchaea archaeon]